MDADLIAALQDAFINIGNTEEGKQVIAIYSHNGYQKAQASDYDNERAAQKLIQELTAARLTIELSQLRGGLARQQTFRCAGPPRA